MAFVYKLNPNAKIPNKANAHDAAYDLFSVEDCLIIPGKTKAVSTGLILAPPIGYYIQILTRSSMALKDVFVVGGVIDAGYRGEIKVLLYSNNGYKIDSGDKIAQFVILPVPYFEFTEVTHVPAAIDSRVDGGFGSSGK